MKRCLVILTGSLLSLQFSCSSKNKYNIQAEIPSDSQVNVLLEQEELLKEVNFPSLEIANGESILIEYTSSGCFHYQHETVILKKIKDEYFVSASKYSAGKMIPVIFENLVKPSIALNLKRFGNYCKQNILEEIKDPNNANYHSTSSKFIFIRLKQDSIYVPIKNLNISYSLIDDFTNQGRFSNLFQGS